MRRYQLSCRPPLNIKPIRSIQDDSSPEAAKVLAAMRRAVPGPSKAVQDYEAVHEAALLLHDVAVKRGLDRYISGWVRSVIWA